MSIESRSPRVMFEAPDFGFGPIATTIEIIRQVISELPCSLVTSGAALQFARQAAPDLITYDYNTFRFESWDRLLTLFDPETLLVSNTNPQLAAWALEHGVRVGVFDTLFWMWDSFPRGLRKADFYVAQWYYSHNMSRGCRPNEPGIAVTWCAPVVGSFGELPVREGSQRYALIGFGGMGLPFDQALPLEFAQWVLAVVLPALFATGHIDWVELIGGHGSFQATLRKQCADDPRVRVIGVLPPQEYRRRLAAAQYLLLTPGLATIYETNAMGVCPLFLPGFNMSMILQARDYCNLSSRVGVVAEWTWSGEIVDKLRTLPEEDGISLLSSRIRSSIREGAAGNEAAVLRVATIDYISRTDTHLGSYGDRLHLPPDLPAVAERIVGVVRNWGLAGVDATQGEFARRARLPGNTGSGIGGA